jgi:hypothetical protein
VLVAQGTTSAGFTANTATVGKDTSASLVASANGSSKVAVLTLQGTPGLNYYTVTPCRIVDTREAAAGAPALLANTSRTFTVAGTCDLPGTEKAVTVNVTVTGATAPGHLRLYPGGTSLPLVSTINYTAGQTRANNALAVLGADGTLAVHCQQASGTVHLILDVSGYLE